jgi:hypothetical protein
VTWPQIAFAALVILILAASWHRYAISRGTLPRLLELYLWLTPILGLAVLGLAYNRSGFAGLVPLAVVHFAVISWALRAVYGPALHASRMWLSGALLIFGAVLVWLGAVSFPGMDLEQIAARRAGHLFTVGGFLAGALVSLAGFAALRVELRERGDALLSLLGLLALAMGTVCWIFHLGFRATVMVAVAQETASASPAWYQPLRLWSGAMYAAYMLLAYLSIAAFGGAMRKPGLVGKAWGRALVAMGLLWAVAFLAGGQLGSALPLTVQFLPYAMGMLLLRRASAPGAQGFSGGRDE